MQKMRFILIYPKNTIIIQLGAKSGQVGLLKSNGKVEDKYTCLGYPVVNTNSFDSAGLGMLTYFKHR